VVSVDGMIARYFQGPGDSSQLRKSLFLSAIIIISNFSIGIFSPTTDGLDDEITFLDTLWRVVAGQRVGIDYHNPMGFGPYQLGALLWHWLGPHYYVMRLSITLFNLLIAFCGCIVAERVLARRTDFAFLFCVTIAFQLSAPGYGVTEFGMAGFYDVQIESALAVLFLLTFGGGSKLSMCDKVVEIALFAILLNVLFLIKISGLVVGLGILLAGCLLQGSAVHRFLNLCAAMLAFGAITAVEFKVTGLELLSVIHDYEFAAHARLDYSFYDLVRGAVSWPLVSSVTLLVLFAVSRPSREPPLDFRCIGLVIGSYAVSQYAMNMTNLFEPNMWLAPAAITSLVGYTYVKSNIQQVSGSASWWQRVAPSRLSEISAREAIPLIIFVFVLAPKIMSSIAGTALGTLVSLGFETPLIVTAGKGVSIVRIQGHQPKVYEMSLNRAVAAIFSLNLGHEAIANIDFANPFPVLFLAPPPKGIQVWWHFGFSVPRDAMLEWQDVIGDACVVTVPAQSDPRLPDVTVRLTDIVRTKLATDFEMVYHDELWSIYRRTGDCANGAFDL
jgi:hypothetical protein